MSKIFVIFVETNKQQIDKNAFITLIKDFTHTLSLSLSLLSPLSLSLSLSLSDCNICHM